jgi:protein SCO1/2
MRRYLVRLILPGILLLSCARGATPPRVEELRGPRLTQGVPRPDFILSKTDGAPFDFRPETRGTLTFLFFGYTNCPDVCPLHMQNLAHALHGLPAETARRVKVVFVTTDPERDTPERLRSWLAKFDSTWVGLTGSPAAIAASQGALGMPPAVREGEIPGGGGYGMTHGAQLWAFTPDDSAHVVYPWGIQQADLAADIPKLLLIWPGTL